MEKVNKFFTLLELLVTISVIVILLSLLLPSLRQAKEVAVKTQCANMLKNYGLALSMYINDNNGIFPATDKVDAVGNYWILAIAEYFGPNLPGTYIIDNIGRGLPHCPKMENSSLFAYGYNHYLHIDKTGARAWRNISSTKPSSLPFLIDHSNRTVWNAASSFDPTYASSPIKYRHQNGGNIIFVDGHVTWEPSRVIMARYQSIFYPSN